MGVKQKKNKQAGAETWGNLSHEELQQKLRRHRRNIILALAGIFTAAGLGVAAFLIYQQLRQYTDYEVVSAVEIEAGNTSTYLPFDDALLCCSADGISCHTRKGLAWSQAYEMKHITMDVCQQTIAVGDVGTNEVLICGSEGKLGEITTANPIVRISVSRQGVVAALTQGDEVGYIEVISAEGENLVTIKAVMNGNGYPVALTLSEDGTKLAVSYLGVSGGVIQSRVVFYNFGEVGKNEVDRMVGGFNQYTDMLVPEVQFLDNDHAVAAADHMLSFYEMKQKPSLTTEIEISQEIVKTFSGDGCIGVVTERSQEENPYHMALYSAEGELLCEASMDTLFDTYAIGEKQIYMYSAGKCMVYSRSGRLRFSCTFEEEIHQMIAIGKKDYVLVKNDMLEYITLK